MGSGKKFSLFFENNQATGNREAAYIFDDPVELIIARDQNEINPALEQIKNHLSAGKFVAGWISYEAGLHFEDKLSELLPKDNQVPYIYMGVFENRKVRNSDDADHYWRNYENSSAYELSNMSLGQTRDFYDNSFSKIQDYLRAGDIYQVNYTQKASFNFKGSREALYADLRNAQQVEYAAFIETDDLTVLSLSPELFIKKNGSKLTAKPMKGTIRRGRTPNEDSNLSQKLFSNEKDRAENLMIVDLLRNDLSKFAKPASVNVAKLYDVEKYRTLFTMTSTIEAELDAGQSAVDALVSIFPCGSVTGAPKIRAQQIIHELEPHQRGIYTGAIGYFTPSGDMCFSVPIRTVVIGADGNGELGIGSAIVADSVAEDEYDECKLKARFVTKRHPRFDLIETMVCRDGKAIERLDAHMDRLSSSANYFDYSCDVNSIKHELMDHVSLLDEPSTNVCKIRLLLSRLGHVSITSEQIKLASEEEEKGIIILSKNSVNTQNTHLYHKTTQRDFYQEEYQHYHKLTTCRDVIFQNENGEITEGSYTNIFVEKDGVLVTPPIQCGLLPGVYRQSLLDDPNVKTAEKILKIDDLHQADQIFICNSVRGMMAVNFKEI